MGCELPQWQQDVSVEVWGSQQHLHCPPMCHRLWDAEVCGEKLDTAQSRASRMQGQAGTGCIPIFGRHHWHCCVLVPSQLFLHLVDREREAGMVWASSAGLLRSQDYAHKPLQWQDPGGQSKLQGQQTENRQDGLIKVSRAALYKITSLQAQGKAQGHPVAGTEQGQSSHLPPLPALLLVALNPLAVPCGESSANSIREVGDRERTEIGPIKTCICCGPVGR